MVRGPDVGRDAVFGSIGTRLTLPDNLELKLGLSGEAKDNAWAQAVVVSLRYKW